MGDLKPSLIKDEQGRVCARVCLGPYQATLPLPEAMAAYTEVELKDFFADVVPKMTKQLKLMRAADRLKFKKRICKR